MVTLATAARIQLAHRTARSDRHSDNEQLCDITVVVRRQSVLTDLTSVHRPSLGALRSTREANVQDCIRATHDGRRRQAKKTSFNKRVYETIQHFLLKPETVQVYRRITCETTA